MVRLLATFAGLLLAFNSFAQAPAGAPAGTTATCNDGTYSSAPSKRGACSGHKGVKDWYASDEKAAPAAPAAAPTPSAPPAAKAGAPVPTTTPAPAATARTASAAPAAGGGSGQVWVNTSSKVYHCQGDRWYGKTKAGSYMTEAAAKQAGARPDHGKGCS